MKKKIIGDIYKVAHFTAAHFNLVHPDDVTSKHVNFAYDVLWSTDYKLEVELYATVPMVKQAIRDAVVEWNVAYCNPPVEVDHREWAA